MTSRWPRRELRPQGPYRTQGACHADRRRGRGTIAAASVGKRERVARRGELEPKDSALQTPKERSHGRARCPNRVQRDHDVSACGRRSLGWALPPHRRLAIPWHRFGAPILCVV